MRLKIWGRRMDLRSVRTPEIAAVPDSEHPVSNLEPHTSRIDPYKLSVGRSPMIANTCRI